MRIIISLWEFGRYYCAVFGSANAILLLWLLFVRFLMLTLSAITQHSSCAAATSAATGSMATIDTIANLFHCEWLCYCYKHWHGCCDDMGGVARGRSGIITAGTDKSFSMVILSAPCLVPFSKENETGGNPSSQANIGGTMLSQEHFPRTGT